MAKSSAQILTQIRPAARTLIGSRPLRPEYR
jgi:hypothetical protein